MQETLLTVIAIWLIVMNLLGVVVMGIDKARAASRKKKRRIPEKMLFLISLLGGSMGTLFGMVLFRHKTKHWYFVIGMPLIAAIHAAVGMLCLMRLG